MKIPKIITTMAAAAFALFILQLFVVTQESAALDAPHTKWNGITCVTCHVSSPPADWWTDQGASNTGLCSQCHNVDHPSMDATIHSGSKYVSFTKQCTICHFPHEQKQYRTYKSASYLHSGAASNVTTTTIRQAGANWTAGAYNGMVLLPNTLYPTLNHQINNNTTDTITIESATGDRINTTYTKAGSTFAVVYGKFIKEVVGGKTVRFFRKENDTYVNSVSGANVNSFADGVPLGAANVDTVVDGICQVCHTLTHSFKNDGTLENTGMGHPGGERGKDCKECHQHTEGFKPTCNSCHGDPPIDDAGLIFKDKNSNAVSSNSPARGFPGVGAHNRHKSASLVCDNCHKGGMKSGPEGDYKINIGFNLGGTNLGGNYEGPDRAVYPLQGNGSTTITTGNKEQCTNLYCHSTGQSLTDGNSNTPTYAAANWLNPSTGACGTCHPNTQEAVNSGSHNKHFVTTLKEIGCSACHTGAADDGSSYTSTYHVNKSINVATGLLYSLDGTPGNGYGTCTSTCHSNGINNAGASNIWGTAGPGCSTCHATPPTTASHSQHLVDTLYAKPVCGDCHGDADAASNTAPTGVHLDGDIDVFNDTAGDLGYAANVAKGGAPYDSCDAAYCHSTGQSVTDGNSSTPTYATVTWGGSAACGSCHPNAKSGANSVNSGSHNKHLSADGVNGCSDCHTEADNSGTSYGSTNHVNHLINVASGLSYTAGSANEPGNGYGTCTATCHSDGINNAGASNIWGTAGAGCSTCHATPPTTGRHTKHLSQLAGSGNFSANAVCGNCHANADAASNTATPTGVHLDGNIDVYDSLPGDLGYPQDKAKNTPYWTCSASYCHSNGLGVNAAANWGGPLSTGCGFCHLAVPSSGAHNAHVKSVPTTYGSTKVSTANGNDFDCGNCHPTDAANHMNNVFEVSLVPAGTTLKARNNAGAINEGMQRTPGSTVICNGAYCHSTGAGNTYVISPNWYATYSGDKCGHCHSNSPNTGSHNAHVVGIHYDNIYTNTTGLAGAGNTVNDSHGKTTASTTINCNICHNETVTVFYNASSTQCSGCHSDTNSPVTGNEITVLAATNAHLNGAANLAFAGANVISKAQIRDDITTVKELNDSWTRPASSYKTGSTPYDTAKTQLNTATMWNSGAKTCGTISCHNGITSPAWGTASTCTICHTTLP